MNCIKFLPSYPIPSFTPTSNHKQHFDKGGKHTGGGHGTIRLSHDTNCKDRAREGRNRNQENTLIHLYRVNDRRR